MSDTDQAWKEWKKRFRDHVEAGCGWKRLAENMNMTPGGVRHYLNSTREVRLTKFFALCKAAKADPAVILFGQPVLNEDMRRAISDMIYNSMAKGITLPLLPAPRQEQKSKAPVETKKASAKLTS